MRRALVLLLLLIAAPAYAGGFGSRGGGLPSVPQVPTFPSCVSGFTVTAPTSPYETQVFHSFDVTLTLGIDMEICGQPLGMLDNSEWSVVAEKYPLQSPPVAVGIGGNVVSPPTGVNTIDCIIETAGLWKVYGKLHVIGSQGGGDYNTTNFLWVSVPQPSSTRLYGENLTYLGAFRCPVDSLDGAVGGGGIYGDGNELSFASGGSSLAYSPLGSNGSDSTDGFPGTLFITGYAASDLGDVNIDPKGGRIGRITIPIPKTSGTLNRAQCKMAPRDVCNPYYDNVQLYNGVQRMGDVFWADSVLYGNIYGYYNEGIDRDHFWTNKDDCTNLSKLMHIGAHVLTDAPTSYSAPWFYRRNCDYLFELPRWWANRYTSGKWLAVGNGSREGGHPEISAGGICLNQDDYSDLSRVGCNLGPGFVVFAPESVAVHAAADSAYEIPAQFCAGYYGSGHSHPVSIYSDDPSEIRDNATDPAYFSDTDFWTDGAWIVNGSFEDSTAQSAVVFFVEKCNHWSHYEHTGGYCVQPGMGGDCCGNNTDGFICGGPYEDGYPNGGSGTQHPCKSPQLWFFSPDDYALVAQGQDFQWSPKAYDVRDLGVDFVNTDRQCDTGNASVGDWRMSCGGVAYDKTRNLLYVAEERGYISGCCSMPPLIHVYHVGGSYP